MSPEHTSSITSMTDEDGSHHYTIQEAEYRGSHEDALKGVGIQLCHLSSISGGLHGG